MLKSTGIRVVVGDYKASFLVQTSLS